MWSCDVAAGPNGVTLVRNLAIATGTGVAAAQHTVGAAALGGSWQLDVRTPGAGAAVPFSSAAIAAFPGLLDAWSPAAPLAAARGYQTATLLGNGKILVAGGQGSNGYLDSAELYDPVSNNWSSAGNMTTARFLHTATLLGNGKVLVTGGFGNSGFVFTAELYDPVSNSWSSAGTLATARDLQTATLLGNGKVLVAGGYNNGVLSSAELYDPVLNSWSAAGSMITARDQQTATLLGNGKVLVTGGEGANFSALASAELYDPFTNSWSSAGSMASARYFQTATLLTNGKVLVAAGVGDSFNSLASAELYDPVANAWSTAGSLVTARNQQTAVLLNNGNVLVTGGEGENALGSSELYDPVHNLWTAAASLATARTNHTATLLGNGQVLVTGGASDSGWLASSELYDPTAAVPASQFLVNLVGGNTVVAGSPFLFTAQAADAAGNPIVAYTGTPNVTTTITPASTLSTFPIPGKLNSSGFGFFQGNLMTAGTYTLTVTTGTVSGTSASITVTPAAASYFTVHPCDRQHRQAFLATVTAYDRFGNIATGYTGTVHFTSSDASVSAGNGLPANATLTNGVGTFNVTLNTAGNQTISATDTVATTPTIIGASNPVNVGGLVVLPGVAGFAPTATGFTVTFNKPFMPANVTMYGVGHATQERHLGRREQRLDQRHAAHRSVQYELHLQGHGHRPGQSE